MYNSEFDFVNIIVVLYDIILQGIYYMLLKY